MKQIKRLGVALLSLIAVASTQAADVNVTANITTDTVWTADNVYILTQIIYIEPGASLTILPGTLIRGVPSPAGEFNPGALVVSRGAKLYANGTPTNPIVMTSQFDLPLGDLPYGVMDRETKGLWGGLIVLGNAPTNLQPGSGNRFVEGLPENALSEFGGTDPDDSSGSISYLSILHGGAKIAADNEINGLTLAGVGRGTCIHHVEIYANLDDGVEWFGGTVNMKYVIVAFPGDDGFDTDYGWNGSVQFGLLLQSSKKDNGDKGSEQDGGKDSDGDLPFGIAKFYNMTLIGDGFASDDGGTKAAIWRDNCANSWYNSIFTDFSGAAWQFEDRDGKEDSFNRITGGDLVLANNIVGIFGGGSTWAELVSVDDDDDAHVDLAAQRDVVLPILAAGGNEIVNPLIGNINRDRLQLLDPRPAAPEVLTGLTVIDERDPFFKAVGYKGAFDPAAAIGETWMHGWSALYNLGHTARPAVQVP
ncbi:MAG: hypothetical protein MI748_18860 [Opitutales bacterium]|nr:hypothetical protein [Opitutales bacterium]